VPNRIEPRRPQRLRRQLGRRKRLPIRHRERWFLEPEEPPTVAAAYGATEVAASPDNRDACVVNQLDTVF